MPCFRPVLDSYPAEAEWPGDGLETELSVVALGSLYGAYARSYTLAEARLAGSTTQVSFLSFFNF